MVSRVLVTGSSAVTGSALKAIQGEYPDLGFVFVRSADCDLTDCAATKALVGHTKVDGIIHLAAVSGGVGLSRHHHGSMLRDNTLMTLNVLEAAREHNVKKTVMTLTTGMYPTSAPIPYREESIHDGPPADNNYGSSFAKRLIDPAVRGYREEYGLSVVGLAPNGIFGEHDNFNEEDAPMLPALIRRFYENRTNDRPLVVWGDGKPEREYTYARDVARAFVWALLHYDEPQFLNIGTTERNSIGAIAHLIAAGMGIDPARIVFDTSKPSSVARRDTDNSRFVDLSGFRYTPFQDGLQQTIRWFADTYDNRRNELRLYRKTKG